MVCRGWRPPFERLGSLHDEVPIPSLRLPVVVRRPVVTRSMLQTAGVSEKHKQDQKAVDTALMKKLSGDRYLTAYLNAKFSLTKNDRVHELRF